MGEIANGDIRFFDDAVYQQLNSFALAVGLQCLAPNEMAAAVHGEPDMELGGWREYRFSAEGYAGHILAGGGMNGWCGAKRANKVNLTLAEEWRTSLFPEDIMPEAQPVWGRLAQLDNYAEFSLITSWAYRVVLPERLLYRSLVIGTKGRVSGTDEWNPLPLLPAGFIYNDNGQNSRRGRRCSAAEREDDVATTKYMDLCLDALRIAVIIERLRAHTESKIPVVYQPNENH